MIFRRFLVLIEFLTILVVFSCSKEEEDGTLFHGSSEFEKYVIKFIDDSKQFGLDVLPHMKGPKLEVKVEQLDSRSVRTLGLCERSSQKRIVTLDVDFWGKANETQKELLISHELGHCVLDREHLVKTLPSGSYSSIMHPYMMAYTTYLKNVKYYISELFTAERGWDESSPEDEIVYICR